MVHTETEPKSQAKSKRPFAEISIDISHWIDGTFNIGRKFGYDLRVVDTDTSHLLLIVSKDNICAQISEERVAHVLASEIARVRLGNPDLVFTARQVEELIAHWVQNTHVKRVPEMPAAFRFFEDKDLCFYRAPEPLPVVSNILECPILMGIRARMSHFDYFAMFLYKGLMPGAYRKQALVIYGEADSGKTAIIEAVSRFLNWLFVTRTTEDFQNQFVFSTIINKKFIYIDEPNPNFIKSTMFKSLTGQDIMSINRKYKETFEAIAEFNFIFTSNEEPPVSSDEAIKTRIIPVHISPLDKEDILHNFKDLIKSEIPHLLAHGRDCLLKYGISPSQEIPVNWDDHQELVDIGNVDSQIAFEKAFVLDEMAFMERQDFIKALQLVNDLSSREARQIAQKIVIMHGLEVSRNRVGEPKTDANMVSLSQQKRCVHGLRPKSANRYEQRNGKKQYR